MRRRLAALALPLAPLLLLAGCLDPDAPEPQKVCAADGSGDQQVYGLLVAREAPDAARPTGERALFQVNVLPGQGLSVEADWTLQAGQAEAFLDGVRVADPDDVGHYAWHGAVEPGLHALEVAGAPLALGADVGVALAATGCPL